MQIRLGYELVYTCPQRTPMILTLNVHYSRVPDLLAPDHLRTQPAVPLTAYRDGFGNWCTRLVAPPGEFRGIPPTDAPMDFSAWLEVYLGGRWHTLDPRNRVPRIGRVLIARGRDAADVPLTNTFGPATLTGFQVWADAVGTA